MKKVAKKNLILLHLLLLLCIMVTFIISNTSMKVYALSSLDEQTKENIDDFADDRVLVVLSNQRTMEFRKYTSSDFSEVGVSSVEELTKSSSEVLKRQMDSSLREYPEMAINIDTYRTILSLKLQQPGKQNVLNAISQLEQRNDILSAEPDRVLHIESTNPNDTYYQTGRQWSLNGVTGINMPNAWEISFGVSTTVRVGVIDTGIDASHPDLDVNTNLSRDFSLPAPYTVTTVTDQNGHGTHVAGIIGAIGNNNTGITGVTQGIELISLRIAPTNLGNSFVSHLVLAIDYAIDADIPILSNSNGTDNFTGNANDINVFSASIANYPGLFVTSAGNGNRNNDNNPNRFPSNVRLPNIISVGATNQNGTRALPADWNNVQGSNWGANTVDIFAPGTDIFSTWRSGAGNFAEDRDYHTTSGTSMATPHVSGVAALLLSHNPNLTTMQLRAAILENVTPVAELTGLCATGGRLNADAALRSVGYETTNLANNNVRINAPATDFSGVHTVPSTLNDRIVTDIAGSAFANQTQLTQITLPSTITTVGNNAFLNTNNAPIHLEGRTIVPSTFSMNWNPSGNPIYLNDSLCTHPSTTFTHLNSTEHGDLCNVCRTAINRVSHSYSLNHTWINLRQHRSYCTCGANRLLGHVVSGDWGGIGYATCLICGGPAEIGFVQFREFTSLANGLYINYVQEYFGNGSYILSNGVIVLSKDDLKDYYDGTLELPNCYASKDCDDYHDCKDCEYHLHESEVIDDSIYLYLDRRDFNYDYYLSRKDEDLLSLERHLN